MITAIVLTYNEEKHIERCLNSIIEICNDIIIVDSFSSDKTKEICEKYSVNFFQNKWTNYSNQFNWAMNKIKTNNNWILRIDADEYLTSELVYNLKKQIKNVHSDVNGVLVDRLMYFMGKPLKRGGMYPIKHLRIWRKGHGKCEVKWMDERIMLTDGKTTYIKGDLVDHNLNSVNWWIAKHNGYAVRESIDYFNKKYNFSKAVEIKSKFNGTKEEQRRRIKSIYNRLPLLIRPFPFFIYRYFFCFGFLDGKRGLIWAFLQCLWYRFLVDTIIYEIKRKKMPKSDIKTYFKDRYGYNLEKINM